MFICEIWLYFLNSAHLICRSTDISKCFSGSLRLRDNKSRLYYFPKRVRGRLLEQRHLLRLICYFIWRWIDDFLCPLEQ